MIDSTRSSISRRWSTIAHTIAFEVTAIGWDGLTKKMEEDSVKRAIEDLIDESQ